MIRSRLSVTSVLDDATDIVSLTAPWAGVAIATVLPYRFLQAVFLDQLIEVGEDAAHYGSLLGGTASLIVASVLFALWGRAVYARACRLAMARGSAPARETWRVPRAALASYVLTGSAAILVGYLSLMTVLGVLVAAMFAGMAIGTMELNERVSVSGPFKIMARYTKSVQIPFAFVFVFFCAIFVALVNLAAAFELSVWLAGSIGGFDAPHWAVLFSGGNRRFVLMLFAGSLALVEPFWIAAHVVFVRRAGAEESGDDLRSWLAELRAS
ncbi:MAG TPA: hypothetical protein VFT12_09395 [Thermoanaerobaculia bacterium]|nr:hypothetical protein [Thermoanaerobaculia bacterium]